MIAEMRPLGTGVSLLLLSLAVEVAADSVDDTATIFPGNFASGPLQEGGKEVGLVL